MKIVIALLFSVIVSSTTSASSPKESKKESTAMTSNDLKQKLSPMQYQVTQHEGTEPPFDNEYWDNKHPGIYTDLVSGEPLFSSKDKYDSGTGWPSFHKTIDDSVVSTRADLKMFIPRTEVRSKDGLSHLGHVFNDGPSETGLRYCMNSAALKFIPLEKLEETAYKKYLNLFTPEEIAAAKKKPYRKK